MGGAEEVQLQERASAQLGLGGEAVSSNTAPVSVLAPHPLTHCGGYGAHLPSPESWGFRSQSGGWGAPRQGVVSDPALSLQVCTLRRLVTAPHLHASLLLYPVPKYREPRVHARLVPLSAAVTPAHHTSLEDAPIGLHTGQGSPGITLRETGPSA